MGGMVVGMRCISAVAALLCINSIALADEEGRRIRLGGAGVNAAYINGPGFWSPWYWGPWGSRHGFSWRPATGEVKLSGAPKDALIFLDGGFAGSVSKLKRMWLEPGAYNLEIRDGDKRWQKRVFVLSGKTVQLHPELTR